MKYVLNYVIKFEKYGDLEKFYKDERIRKKIIWMVKEIVKNLYIIGKIKKIILFFFINYLN